MSEQSEDTINQYSSEARIKSHQHRKESHQHRKESHQRNHQYQRRHRKYQYQRIREDIEKSSNHQRRNNLKSVNLKSVKI